jgi:two-component system, OmpR family, response regulator
MRILAFIHGNRACSRVKEAFGAAQLVVDTAESVEHCTRLTKGERYDGIVVDVESISFADVLALVTLLRHASPVTALFVIVRYLDLDQRVRLFEAGVDGCVLEPFFASELAVRVQLSIRLRRAAFDLANGDGVSKLRVGPLELDLVRREVARSGKAIGLRPKEFLLLEYLVRNTNRPVTRTMILEYLWNSSFEGLTNVVDVHINALRRKVDKGYSQKLIQTNRGIGYTLVSSAPVQNTTLNRG